MNDYKIYLGGEFVSTNKQLDVSNPYDQKTFATTYQASQAELEVAIQKAEAIKEELAEFPAYKRYEILRYVSDELMKNKQDLGTILAQESGKPMIYAVGEIERASQTFLVAAEEAKRIPSEMMSMDWTAKGANRDGIIKYFPSGIVAGISPFNFPLNLAVHKIAPAIAAGCPIILKPASNTPLSTLKLAEILDKTDLPKGAVSILPMDRATGNQLVTDDRFALLSFTGSPIIGWKMKAEAGKKKVVLELGGNAASIITPSADIKLATKKAIIGGFAYSGQVCIHLQRIYVHESMIKDFVQEYVTQTEALTQGAPTEQSTQFSSVIDEKNAVRIKQWIDEAVAGGAKILTGGNQKGTFVEPTVLTNTSKDMKVCSQEVFGPVVVIEPYSDFDEVLTQVNDSDFGLQASIFSTNIHEIQKAFHKLEVGGLMVNEIPTYRLDHMPYGGVKESGLGREGVKYAILDMMEPRIMILDRD